MAWTLNRLISISHGSPLISNFKFLQNSSTFVLFQKHFELEYSQLREFSFTDQSESVGVCILGRDQEFIDRFYRFVPQFPFFAVHDEAITLILDNTPPSEIALKVDWNRNEALQFTLYFRIKKGSSNQWLNSILSKYSDWKGIHPERLSQLFLTESPFCYGIRIGLNQPLIFSSYVNVNLKKDHFFSKVHELLVHNQWPLHLENEIFEDLNLITLNHVNACVGIESQGDILKLDIAGLNLGKVIKFLKQKNVPQERIHSLIQIAKDLGQIRTNYFAIKYNPNGFTNWKVYFALIGKHHN